MPTNVSVVSVDKDLLDEALSVGGLSTKKEIVHLALTEFVQHRERQEIVELSESHSALSD